jgi:hypothetical protein
MDHEITNIENNNSKEMIMPVIDDYIDIIFINEKSNNMTPVEEILKKMYEYIALLSEEIKSLKIEVRQLKVSNTE